MAGAPSSVGASPDLAKCRDLAQQVAASQVFRRSARQRELFLYLCRIALDEPGTEVNEQRIGIDVFGRPADYDTAEDTIVRVHVSELRKRLKTYFETEGVASPLVIEIPKGSYVPIFAPRSLGTPALSPKQPRWGLAPMIALAAALLGWWARGLWDDRNDAGELLSQPALSRLWSRFDRPDQRTWVVVADSTHGLLQDLRRQSVLLADYAGREYWRSQEVDDVAKLLKNREYTGMAELALSRKLAVGFGRRHTRLQTVFARHFQMRQLNSDNAVLIGSKRSNPWAEMFEPMMNFTFDYEEATARALVRNRNPRPGEAPVYAASIAGEEVKRGYAVVAFLPNLRKTGDVLLLAGTSGAETEIAGYFVTTEEPFARFVAQISRGSNGRLPYFELLLKTQRLGQETQRYEFIAYREISGTGYAFPN